MKLVTALFLFSFCLACKAFAQSSEWPGWRGPEGTGISTESGWNPLSLRDGAKILWTADVGAGYSNIAIKDNRIYATGRDRKSLDFFVSCLDAATGKLIWRCDTIQISGEVMSTPATDGDFLYGIGKDGTIWCLRAANATLLWSKNLVRDFTMQARGVGFACSPVIEGDLLLVSAGKAGLALNRSTGALAWTNGADEYSYVASYASPVVWGTGNSRTALFYGGDSLSAVQVATGRVLWSYEHGGMYEVIADPIPVGARTFFSHLAYGMLLETNGNQVTPVWKSEGLRGATASAVLVNGCLFGSDWPYFVSWWDWGSVHRLSFPFRCLDVESGLTRWETTAKLTTVTAADGKLLLLDIDGTLCIAEASPAGYHEFSKADVFNGANKPRLFTTPPVLLDGKVYCRNYQGDLVCIDMRS